MLCLILNSNIAKQQTTQYTITKNTNNIIKQQQQQTEGTHNNTLGNYHRGKNENTQEVISKAKGKR